MHIGIVSQFNVSHVTHLLNDESRERAQVSAGRTNTPVCNLLSDYIKAGHHVSVFAAENSVALPTAFYGDNLSIYIVPHRNNMILAQLDGFKQERSALVERIKEINPDVVHGQWTHTGHALAALDSGLPCVVTLHDAALTWARMSRSLHPSNILRKVLHLKDTFLVARRVKTVIGVAPFTIDHFRNIFQYSGASYVVPNGQVFEEDSYSRLRKFNPEEPVFVDITGWGHLKNTKTLLRAFFRLRENIPKARLILYGRELGFGQKGYNWAKKRCFVDHVDFRGYAKGCELDKALREESDIFVHPSFYEACCMSICEAVIAGLPCIVSNRGGNRWMLDNSSACRFVNPADVQQFSDTMLDVVTHFSDYQKNLDGLQEKMRTEFSPAKIVQELVEIYENVISGSIQA